MDDYNYTNYIKKSFDLKSKREEQKREMSREKLLNISKKKIQTTMIGAISSIESHLGFLWDVDNPTAEQKSLRNIFEEMRSEILDRGNTQMRNLENEFNSYDITWKKYTMNLPFMNRGDD